MLAFIISIDMIVNLVVYLLVVGVVFGLLFFLIGYIERSFPGEGMSMFCRFARIALVVLGVLLLIGIVLSLAGHPVVELH
jgi:hypothetical protein